MEDRLNYKITNRLITVLYRWIDVNHNKWEGMDQNDIDIFYFGKDINWGVSETDDSKDELYHFSLYYKEEIQLYSIDFDTKEQLETEVERFSNDVFTFCKCEKALTEKDGWCENCYIHRASRGENCSICLEDEGRYIQLDQCKHYFHLECFNKFKNTKKCPLCRAAIQSHTIDPFDV